MVRPNLKCGIKKWKTRAVAAIAVMMSCYILYVSTTMHLDFIETDVTEPIKEADTNGQKQAKYENSTFQLISNIPTFRPDKMTERAEGLQQSCHPKVDHTAREDELTLLYLPNYQLATKLVPKVGSTFMIQLFSILTNNSKHPTETVFYRSRRAFQAEIFHEYDKTFTTDTIHNVTTLIFARNPFSRLFSAFVDKVYILNNLYLATIVLDKANKTYDQRCVLNVDFTDFLKHALYSHQPYKGDHYTPITDELSIPVICKTNELMIVKQESFSDDMKYVLNKLHIEQDKLKVIHDALYGKRAETTITSIAKTAFDKYAKLVRRFSCITWHNLAEILWYAFQIQGYIHQESVFPVLKFTSFKGKNYDDKKNQEFLKFLKVVLETIHARPVSHEQSVYQRTKALVDAYKTISSDDLRAIYKRYNLDFLLFQYDKSVPHM